MTRRRIWHVDAFTYIPLEGNPAAVVEGDGLATGVMQQIALNQKLSETVFLLAPDDPMHDAKLRIFTPAVELPFAGHPTIAAAHIIATTGRAHANPAASLRLETGAGVIPLTIAGDPPLYTMTQARPQFRTPSATTGEIASWLDLRPDDVVLAEDVSTGIWWLCAQLASLEAMRRVVPDLQALWGQEVSIFCIGAEQSDARVHVRTFAPAAGVVEDPVTGSSNGCIAALIARHALLPPREGAIEYVAEQGIEMGQPGRVFVRVTGTGDDCTVEIGGHAVTVLDGELILSD
jgi:PhzF family phenazine biosynthesis protein